MGAAERASGRSRARGGRGRGCARSRRTQPTCAPRPSSVPAASALVDLGRLDLRHELSKWVYTLQSPLAQARGALRQTLRSALETLTHASEGQVQAAGWKLFLLAPRMLLYRSRGQHHIAPEEISRRVQLLADRRWGELLEEASAAAHADPVQPRKAIDSRPSADEGVRRRAERAAALAQLGELSAASSALTAAPLAPLTTDTLDALRDPLKRPQERQVPLPNWLADYVPEEGPLTLDAARFCTNVRSARRGAAAGPSGCAMEHLCLMMKSASSCLLASPGNSWRAPCRVRWLKDSASGGWSP